MEIEWKWNDKIYEIYHIVHQIICIIYKRTKEQQPKGTILKEMEMKWNGQTQKTYTKRNNNPKEQSLKDMEIEWNWNDKIYEIYHIVHQIIYIMYKGSKEQQPKGTIGLEQIEWNWNDKIYKIYHNII